MKEALEKINNQVNLSMIEMQDAMNQIMSGKVNDIDIESFLIGLNTKGISEEEITAAAMIMREKSLQIAEPEEPDYIHLIVLRLLHLLQQRAMQKLLNMEIKQFLVSLVAPIF